MSEAIKFLLPDDRIPKAWYNIVADLPQPLPPVLNSATGKPVGPEDLAPLFPMSLILQEVSAEREIEIPGPVRDVYRLWRPTPLRRARSLELLLDTPARIFYKDETAAPTGSFKPNESVAQAFYSREAGAKKIVSFTGAGQWGSALACSRSSSASRLPSSSASSASVVMFLHAAASSSLGLSNSLSSLS